MFLFNLTTMTIILIPLSILFVNLFFFIQGLKQSSSTATWKSQQIQGRVLLGFLGLLFALRANTIGNDTKNYFELFQIIKNYSTQELLNFSLRFEIGFVYLNKLSSLIYDNYFFLQIIVGLFVYSITYKFIKEYSPYIGISIIVFFFARYHDAYMNIMRQAIATGFTLWGYMRLKKGKSKQFLLLVLLAYTMHKSAIVFLLVWPFTKITYKPKYLKYFIIACFTIFVLGGTIITFMIASGILPNYYEDSEYIEGGKIAPAIILFMNIVIFLFFYLNKGYKLKVHKGKQLYGSDMTWLLMIGILIQITALWFANMGRVSWYYSIFNIIAISYALTKIKNSNRIIISICVTISYITYYYIILIYRPGWNIVYPYKFFF